MKLTYAILCVLLILTTIHSHAFAQSKPKGKVGFAMNKVKVNKTLEAVLKKQGEDKITSLRHLSEAFADKLVNRLNNSNKFVVVTRRDFDAVRKDQELQSVFADSTKPDMPEAFKALPSKYLVVITVNHFIDKNEQFVGEGGQVKARKYSIDISATAKFIDVTTKQIYKSVEVKHKEMKVQRHVIAEATEDTPFAKEIQDKLVNMLALKASMRFLDLFYTAKVLSIRDNVVFINRGDRTGIAKDQVWSVYALGEKLVDEDTGEVLGAEEVFVGKVKVSSLTPKFSKAKVIEDLGIAKGHVVRLNDYDSLDVTSK